MKLATYEDGSRDGQLVVVSRDLSMAHFAHGIASRMQQLLDDWSFLSPQLEDLYATLNGGKARHAFAFEPRLCAAPLPRAYQLVEGAAYRSHGTRLRSLLAAEAQAEEAPAARGDPRLTQRASDTLRGACADIACAGTAEEVDIEPGLAIVTGDVEQGIVASAALERVRLIMLVNAWQLRQRQAAERAAGQAPFHSRAATAFGPVAVTPDELGEAWAGGRVLLNLEVQRQGKRIGLCAAGDDMDHHFGQLIAHTARSRDLRAGSIVGSGPVSQRDETRGFGSIAERRALELQQQGAAKTPYLQPGERVRVEVRGQDGQSVFGAIDQQLVLRGEDA